MATIVLKTRVTYKEDMSDGSESSNACGSFGLALVVCQQN